MCISNVYKLLDLNLFCLFCLPRFLIYGDPYMRFLIYGVRQGGVLSPKLFAIYIDDLSNELALCKSGCYINEQCMNHVIYADDICFWHQVQLAYNKC